MGKWGKEDPNAGLIYSAVNIHINNPVDSPDSHVVSSSSISPCLVLSTPIVSALPVLAARWLSTLFLQEALEAAVRRLKYCRHALAGLDTNNTNVESHATIQRQGTLGKTIK